jgi:uroporphyrinogen-III synthase
MIKSKASPQQPLRGLTVVVTRPSGQGDEFCYLIETGGGQVIRFPLLEITPSHHMSHAADLIKQLDNFDMAIFVSRNAVVKAMEVMSHLGVTLPRQLQLVAVGQKTAQALAHTGHAATVVPAHHFDSEALLAMREMHHVKNRRIVIFRGEGGRALLGDTLTARGAWVEYAEVYCRRKPSPSIDAIEHTFFSSPVDIVTITSTEALQNLHELLVLGGYPQTLKMRLLIGGRRMVEKALSLGFVRTLHASDPTDRTMFNAVVSWAEQSG